MRKTTMIQIRNVPDEFHRRIEVPMGVDRGHVDVRLRSARSRESAGSSDAPRGDRTAARPASASPEEKRCRSDPGRTGRAVIVRDASAVVELLLNRRPAARSRPGLRIRRLRCTSLTCSMWRWRSCFGVAPETASSTLQRQQRRSTIVANLDLQRHAHEPLLDRIWQLRQNLTAYDAAYVALAEVLDAALLTCDVRLARRSGAQDSVWSLSGFLPDPCSFASEGYQLAVARQIHSPNNVAGLVPTITAPSPDILHDHNAHASPPPFR